MLAMRTESGRLRSPPLVDKFRRAKEATLNAKLRSEMATEMVNLEQMFHQVGGARSSPSCDLQRASYGLRYNNLCHQWF